MKTEVDETCMVCITLTNSKSFILYNKELNDLFDELESRLTSSGADLIYLQDAEVIPRLNRVLPRSLDILAISKETIILTKGPDGLVVETVKFFVYYNDNCKKYTIKLL